MNEFWDDLWKRERAFLSSGGGEYRHDASFVAVSTLAGQYYCEYKAENEYAFGEVPTEAKEAGTALHDELIPTKEITEAEFVELVGKKEPSYAVLNVWGSVGGLRMVGTPDHIVWSAGKPLWLVELKTTKGDPGSLWEDQESQVRVYGLLLDVMGLDCSKLGLALARVRADGLDAERRREWITEVSSALLKGATKEMEKRYGGSLKVHLFRHDRRAAVRAVTAKAGYWLREREPTSSTSVGKCRACEYADKCVKSLVRVSDRERRPV